MREESGDGFRLRDHAALLGQAHAVFGHLLQVTGYDSATINERRTIDAHLADTMLLQDRLVERVIAAGLQGLYVGRGRLADLDDLAHLAGYPGYENSPAAYDRVRRNIVVGTRGHEPHRQHNVLHEFGHAIGHLLGLNDAPVLIAHHQNPEVWLRLPLYYRGRHPGDEYGRSELLAEAVRDLILGRASVSRRYGAAFIRWLSQELNLP